MRKTLRLSFLLLILAVAGMTGFYIFLHGQQDDITISQKTLYGNPASAAGLSVTINADGYGTRWGRRCNWDLRYTLQKDGELKSDVHYSAYNKKIPQEESKSVFLSASLHEQVTLPENAPENKFKPGDPVNAIFDVISEAPVNQTYEKTINLADYYDYLSVYINQGSYQSSFTLDKDANYEFTDFSYFQIPMPDSYKLHLSVRKNLDGTVSYVNFDSYPEAETDEDYPLDSFEQCTFASSGQVLQNYCYLAVSHIQSEANPKAIALPEKMRGIHMIPLVKSKSNESRRFLNMDKAKLIYPLSADEKVLHLTSSDDEKTLFLLTLKGSDFFATILQPQKDGSLTEIKHLQLLSGFDGFWESEDHGYRLISSSDGFTLVLHNGDFCTVAKIKGEYQIGSRSTLKECSKVPDMAELFLFHNTTTAVAIDGTKTYFLIPSADSDYSGEIHGLNHYLLVYDGTDLTYAGKISYTMDHSEDVSASYADDPQWNAQIPAIIETKPAS